MPIQKTPGNPRSTADLKQTPRKSRKIPRFGRSLLENGRSGNRRFQISQESTRFGVFELGRSSSISNLYTNPLAEIDHSKPLFPYKHQARPNRHAPQPEFPAGARPGKCAEVVACSRMTGYFSIGSRYSALFQEKSCRMPIRNSRIPPKPRAVLLPPRDLRINRSQRAVPSRSWKRNGNDWNNSRVISWPRLAAPATPSWLKNGTPNKTWKPAASSWRNRASFSELGCKNYTTAKGRPATAPTTPCPSVAPIIVVAAFPP